MALDGFRALVRVRLYYRLFSNMFLRQLALVLDASSKAGLQANYEDMLVKGHVFTAN